MPKPKPPETTRTLEDNPMLGISFPLAIAIFMVVLFFIFK